MNFLCFQLMKWLMKNESKNLSTPKLVQEILVGTAYANATKNTTNDALPLITILPLTTASKQPRAVSRDYLIKSNWIFTVGKFSGRSLAAAERAVEHGNDLAVSAAATGAVQG
jgi:hypothetical protein